MNSTGIGYTYITKPGSLTMIIDYILMWAHILEQSSIDW